MRRMLLLLSLLILPLFYWVSVSENASTGLLNTLTPGRSFKLERNVSFGDHERDRIDYYMSTKDGASDKPLLVFIHGGGWNRGDKTMYKFLAEGLTSEGYDVALPNYRMHPEVGYPHFLTDNARAIAAIHKQYPERFLVLIGHSAGAYNALMMVVRPQYLDREGIMSCYTVQGVVSLAAPTGAYPAESEPTTTIFPNNIQGDEGPLNHTDQPLMPIMLVNGDQDSSVRFENAVKMGEKMNGRAQVKIYPGADHVDPVKQFSRFFAGPIKTDVVDFIKALPTDQGDGFCKV